MFSEIEQKEFTAYVIEFSSSIRRLSGALRLMAAGSKHEKLKDFEDLEPTHQRDVLGMNKEHIIGLTITNGVLHAFHMLRFRLTGSMHRDMEKPAIYRYVVLLQEWMRFKKVGVEGGSYIYCDDEYVFEELPPAKDGEVKVGLSVGFLTRLLATLIAYAGELKLENTTELEDA